VKDAKKAFLLDQHEKKHRPHPPALERADPAGKPSVIGFVLVVVVV
jgi:hypothetical protein